MSQSTSPPSLLGNRLDDPQAVTVDGAAGDGATDATATIQSAIDEVATRWGQGVVFLPQGRYRLTRSLMIWPGIRLIGYGSARPTLFLAANTPGYAVRERFMVFFAGHRPEGASEEPIAPENKGISGDDLWFELDANPGTFYSALSNVNFEIADGNPGAVGVRARFAQHCFLSHIDFRLQSGLAAVHDSGNLIHDVRFLGGRFGLLTQTPSPGWQLTVMDCEFQGQTQSAIYTRATGLTLVRPTFRNVSHAVEVDPRRTEQLWMKDARLENVSQSALLLSQTTSQRTQINVEDAVCVNTPTFAEYRESGRKIAGKGETYRVDRFSHGLTYPYLGSTGDISTQFVAQPVETVTPPTRDVPPLPPSSEWVNVQALGATGNGVTDDTEAIQKAIAAHRVLFFPAGKYRVTDTITLRPDSVTIGLNPITTQLVLADRTPGFGAQPPRESRRGPQATDTFPGKPKALLESPSGGTCIFSGVGLDSGGDNPAAVACLWKAGESSLLDDVKFVGGHGSNVPIYNADHSGDPDPLRKWDSQYPSLWVTDGGGGTFRNLWTASTFAQSGMLVTNTKTPGRVYEMSSEHHVRYEVQLRNVENWDLIALQTEEERGEGPFCLPLDIENCHNITVANLNMYRVVSVTQPYPYAVKVSGSRDIRFRNVHCYSNCKASFDNLLLDSDQAITLRQREFANLDLDGQSHRPVKLTTSVVSPNAKVERLATGFFNVSGGAVAPNGDYAFVDAKRHRIYRWQVATGTLETVSDAPLSPVNLVFDDSGNLLVISYTGKGTVFVIPDGKNAADLTLIKATPATERANVKFALPDTDWILPDEFRTGQTVTRPFHYLSPDGTVAISTRQDFVDGSLTWGIKLQDVIRSFGLRIATPGKPIYMTTESDMRTYAMDVDSRGDLQKPRLFAECGGESVATDSVGNVYIAAGQIYVFSPDGKSLGTIEVPERPINLCFGGPDGKTLFIAARTSIYSVRVAP